MIPQETIQQIVSRIDIIELVGEFVRLRRRGANYLGLCPFHDEKTPSFTVSPTKEIYKCFGCGRSGNAITFLMEHEKYSYVEALKWLAAKYNVEIQETEPDPEYRQRMEVAESLYAINNFAQEHFADSLIHTSEGKDAGLSYLQERGFREHIIKKFGLGYCGSDNSFAQQAIRNQFNKELLEKSGLVVFRGGSYMDNYRGRIIFPVHNQSGKIAGFGARQIKKNEKSPKYINTPENEIYVKSKILYGLWQARRAIGTKDECILVEGYTDVVSLHQSGIENVVASGGTSLTRDQLRLIRKITRNLTIFYDGDNAGAAATVRGLNLALEEGLTVKILSLPAPEDPDSYIHNYGAAALEEYIRDHKKEFIFFQLDLALQEASDNPHKKTEAVRQIAGSISKLTRPEDFIVRQDYIRKVAEKLNIDEEGLVSLINNIIRENIQTERKKFFTKQESPDVREAEDDAKSDDSEENDNVDSLFKTRLDHENALVRCLLEYGQKEWDKGQKVADYLLKDWEIEDVITDDELSKIIHIYKTMVEKETPPDIKFFIYNEDSFISRKAVSLIEFPYEVSKNWEEKYNQAVPSREEQYIADITSTLRYIDLKNIRKLLTENEIELKKNTDKDRLEILLKTHQHLKKLELDLAKPKGTVIM